MMTYFSVKGIAQSLLYKGISVTGDRWQGLRVEGTPQASTVEITNVCYTVPVNVGVYDLGHPIHTLKPNLPWAENHFQERVGGVPLNPGQTYKEWPWYKRNVEQHKEDGKFSHTYMERYWPRNAGNEATAKGVAIGYLQRINRGIRFEYGDLNDVVNLLAREPTTRQAYLPVWFPEDTGAVHGHRVPCSLGYLFLMREGRLNITYYIRSCDFYRHFSDDVYITARLCQWVLRQLQYPPNELKPSAGVLWDHGTWEGVTPGQLIMHIGSLHIFEDELPRLRRDFGYAQE